MAGRQNTTTKIDRVGLDIGTHSVTGVEITSRGSEIVIHSAGSITIPRDRQRPAGVVAAIKQLWNTCGFSCRRVYLALPSSAVYMKWLNLEAENEEELDNVARATAVRGAPFPASDAIVDYRRLPSCGGSSRNTHLVMLAAASSSSVDGLLNIVESAGLEAMAVDIEPVATARGFAAQKHTANQLWSGQPHAHCRIGASNTVIEVTRGDALEFARSVPVGGNDFTTCIAEALQISFDEAERIKHAPGCRLATDGSLIASLSGEQVRVGCEAIIGRLAREMHRSLKFFRSQYADGSYLGMTSAATLSGGGALLRGIDVCLEEQGLEVSAVVNPFTGLSVAADGKGISGVVDSAAQYTTAVGLALADYWENLAEQHAAA